MTSTVRKRPEAIILAQRQEVGSLKPQLVSTERPQNPAFSPQMPIGDLLSVLSPPSIGGGFPEAPGFCLQPCPGGPPQSPEPPPATHHLLPSASPPPTLVHSDIRSRAHSQGGSRTTKMLTVVGAQPEGPPGGQGSQCVPSGTRGRKPPGVSSESTNPIRWARRLGGTFLHVNSRHKLRPQRPPSHLHEAGLWTPLFTLSPLVWTSRVGKSILTSQPGLEVPHHTAWPHAQDPLGPRAAEEKVQPHTHTLNEAQEGKSRCR